MSTFFEMGGYGAYIWPAYAVTFTAAAILIWQSLRAHAAARRLVARLEQIRATAPPTP